MALLLSEGFGALSTFTDLTTTYGWGQTITNAAVDSLDATGGYNSAPAFKTVANGSGCISSYSCPTVMAPAANELRFGLWYKTSAAAATQTSFGNNTGIITFHDASFAKFMCLRMTSTGKVGFTWLRASATNTVDYSGTLVSVNDGQQHWIEGRIILGGASNGTVQIWVDGTLDINQTGITNDPNGYGLTCTSMTRIELGSWIQTNATSQWISHVMVWDTSGTVLNGYLGPSRIETIIPNAIGDLSQLSPTAGANYTNVNETVANFDTNYVEGVANALVDLYNYTTLATTPTTIKGVVVKTFAKNADIGTKTFRNKASSSAVIANGTTQTLTSAYKMYTEFFTVDPNTAAAWTKAGIDSAQFGVEVQI